MGQKRNIVYFYFKNSHNIHTYTTNKSILSNQINPNPNRNCNFKSNLLSNHNPHPNSKSNTKFNFNRKSNNNPISTPLDDYQL
jgi:hypothetical protein